MKLHGINYSKQIRDKDCFPTALANAMKWSGTEFSYKNCREDIYKIFETTNETGTLLSVIELICTKKTKVFPFNITKVKKESTFDEIKKHIDKGGSVIYTFVTDQGNFHSTFIEGFYDNNHLYMVNFHTGYTLSIVPKSVINNTLKNEVLCIFISRKS